MMLIICVIICLFPLILFLIKFHSQPWSNSSNDWTNFAGFWSDILSPLFNIANIVIVYYLAIKVASLDEERAGSQLEIENTRRRNDFKFSAYKEISGIVTEVISYTVNPPKEQTLIEVRFKYTLETYIGLFNKLTQQRIDPLVNKVNKINELNKPDSIALLKDLNTLIKDLVSELGFG